MIYVYISLPLATTTTLIVDPESGIFRLPGCDLTHLSTTTTELIETLILMPTT